MYMITSLLVGILFLILAYLVGKKRKINIIHTYHYRNVKDEDKLAYCKEYGKGLNIIGISSLIMGILDFWFKTEGMWYIYLVCIFYAFFIFHKAQMKYNDRRWFS